MMNEQKGNRGGDISRVVLSKSGSNDQKQSRWEARVNSIMEMTISVLDMFVAILLQLATLSLSAR